jgi:Fe-Mn family superoxide dismutase
MSAPFTLPDLPYAYDALEPHIDARTMEIHHSKHHGTYVNNLNAAIEKAPEIGSRTLDELLSGINSLPEAVRTAVRNNGGGHWNHTLFWQLMAPATGAHVSGPHADGAEHAPNVGNAAASALDEAMRASFGSYVALREQFSAAAVGRFGSGWAWLVCDGNQLVITTTPNQNNPLMDGVRAEDILLGLDVWEHAYYLKYQNRRADYVKAWWNLINWPEVARRFEHALAGGVARSAGVHAIARL